MIFCSVCQIFNDLDVQDDKLMLDLAVFLNRLVSLIHFFRAYFWFCSHSDFGGVGQYSYL